LKIINQRFGVNIVEFLFTNEGLIQLMFEFIKFFLPKYNFAVSFFLNFKLTIRIYLKMIVIQITMFWWIKI